MPKIAIYKPILDDWNASGISPLPKYSVTASGCWKPDAKCISISGGYASIKRNGRLARLHIISCLHSIENWERIPFLDELVVLHSEVCVTEFGNAGRACFNPEHLRLGTESENTRDRKRHNAIVKANKVGQLAFPSNGYSQPQPNKKRVEFQVSLHTTDAKNISVIKTELGLSKTEDVFSYSINLAFMDFKHGCRGSDAWNFEFYPDLNRERRDRTIGVRVDNATKENFYLLMSNLNEAWNIRYRHSLTMSYALALAVWDVERNGLVLKLNKIYDARANYVASLKEYQPTGRYIIA